MSVPCDCPSGGRVGACNGRCRVAASARVWGAPDHETFVPWPTSGGWHGRNKPLITASNKRLITASNKRLITASNKGLITASNKGLITANNKGLITASNKGLITASNKGLITASNKGLGLYPIRFTRLSDFP